MYLQVFIILMICPIVYNSSELHLKYAGQALNALERLLNFFESDVNNLNLDGLYGLRIAQGQLNDLHDILNQHIYLTDKNHIISSLSKQIERIANISLNQIQRKDALYLHRFALVSYKPFIIEYQPRKIHKHLIETSERNSDFHEDESDKCFAELLGKKTKIFI